VQFTPRGSGCSIVFGDLPPQREMEPGSLKGLQLVVSDGKAAREELIGRGVECSELQVFSPDDGGTFFGFADPDGNTWGGEGAAGAGREAADPRGAPGSLRGVTGAIMPA
jgi:hypothetical protein